MSYRVWPRSLEVAGASYQLVPRALIYESASDGSVSAVEMSGGGCWMISFKGTGLYDRSKRRAFRALLASLNGPVNPVVVPIWDETETPISWAEAQGEIPHSDTTFFGDLAGYLNSGAGGTLRSTARLRATTLSVSLFDANSIEPGQWLTVQHADKWGVRLHVITDVAGSGTNRTITIEPPLRSLLAAGSQFSLERPACTMRLAKDQGMTYEDPGWSDIPRPDVSFVEAFF